MNGIELITAERNRQVESEGWTPEHDAKHTNQELANAAADYMDAAALIQHGFSDYARLPISWPWAPAWWKPSPDPVRNLVKAGALIAAEIDRIQKLK